MLSPIHKVLTSKNVFYLSLLNKQNKKHERKERKKHIEKSFIQLEAIWCFIYYRFMLWIALLK